MKASALHHLAAGAFLVIFAVQAHAGDFYRETDLVSDIPGRAARTDPDLINPWGLIRLRDGVFGVADNGSGVSTAYGRRGAAADPKITIPPAGSGNPTGVALNVFRDAFRISESGRTGSSKLVFVSEDGSISAWSPEVDRDEAIKVLSTTDAVYKGLALGQDDHGPLLFAANFHAGSVDVFDREFHPVHRNGAFTDPGLPAGYGPFNVQNLRGELVVTYAKQDPDRHDDVPGPGFGFVDVYDTGGRLLRRFASQGTLNAPWGIALAPNEFGQFGGALLIGNFGDGRINAFDWATGRFLGQLSDEHGNPIAIEGLWGLAFGDRRHGRHREDLSDGDDEQDITDLRVEDRGEDHGRGEHHRQNLYFAAGINDEAHGLFGFVAAVGEKHRDDDPHLVTRSPDPDGMQTEAGPQVTPVGSNPIRLSGGSAALFRITMAHSGIVRVGIFDVAGRLVAEPIRDQEVTGATIVRWDGVDTHGARVGAGTYFYRVVSGPRAVGGHLVIMP